MKKTLILLCLVHFSTVYPSTIPDYFPLNTGDSWFYQGMQGGDPNIFITVYDTITRHGQPFYIMQFFDQSHGIITYPDTIRKDTSGNIWRLGDTIDTLWLDLSTDTNTEYQYGRYHVTITMVDTISTPSGMYNNCLSLLFTDSLNLWYSYVFNNNVGMVDYNIHGWQIKKLKSATVNGIKVGLPPDSIDYFPLQLGNVWVNSRNNRDVIDTIISTIVGQEIVAGKTYFKLIMSNERNTDTSELLLRKEVLNGNVYIYMNGKEELFRHVDFSITEGEPCYYNNLFITEPDTGIASWFDFRDITVPIGAFTNCRYYKMDNLPGVADDEYFYVFAPGIGIIKEHDAHSEVNIELLYAVISGNYIGPPTAIQLQVSQNQQQKIYQYKIAPVFDAKFLFLNSGSDIFSLNGKRMPGKSVNASKGVYIMRNSK